MTIYDDSLVAHKRAGGKLKVLPTLPMQDTHDLSIVYTPGVAQVCREIAKNPLLHKKLTWAGRLVAVVSDGTAVLGLGSIGPKAALPVMEGKCALITRFSQANAIPLVIDASSPEEIIAFVKALVPSVGAVNLEDIKAPECFVVEDALQDVGIPVFHDDQHGTAIVVLSALLNALQQTHRDTSCRVVVAGAGAAGLAISRLLLEHGFSNLSIVDSVGVISEDRADLSSYKQDFAQRTKAKKGSLQDALVGADVFIGVSKANLVTAVDIRLMAENAIVFALSNPDPELSPNDAKQCENIALYATGRSDLPNQINNAIIFPGLFRGWLDVGATRVDRGVFAFVAKTVAAYAGTQNLLAPKVLDDRVHEIVRDAVIMYHTRE